VWDQVGMKLSCLWYTGSTGRIYAIQEVISYFQATLRILDELSHSRNRLEQLVTVNMKHSFMMSLMGKYEYAFAVL